MDHSPATDTLDTNLGDTDLGDTDLGDTDLGDTDLGDTAMGDTDADRTVASPTVSRCPVAHVAPAQPARCPFPHDGDSRSAVTGRSRADLVVRRVLRIRERPLGVTAASAYSSFQRSMLISAIRCTLTYVVFPFVLPAVGFATGVGPWVGIVIGVVAITCDVFTIRRFFSVDHRYRWHFSAVALAVIGLLSVLLVQDVVHVVT
jgi:hypothetical protein